jgi:GNAT superfamily N-acetyltransferase
MLNAAASPDARSRAHALALRSASSLSTAPVRMGLVRKRGQSAHTEWMNECVSTMMGNGTDQLVAVAACLNMWRDAWEESHPDGADDPGPSPKEQAEDSPLADKSLARTGRPLRYVPRRDVEDEPRDEHGRWTDGGGGSAGSVEPESAFVSPNIAEHLDFSQAVAGLNSPRQQQLTKASAEIDKELGITSTNSRVIGAWADGAENSMMVTAKGASPAAMRAASAMKGWLADQKAVLVFHPAKGGKELLAHFDVKGDVNQIHADLLKDGVAFHTLEPIGDGKHRVHVYATDNATVEAVRKAAQHNDNASVRFTTGAGEFIGTKLETGSDREQRDDARRVYSETIRQIADSGGLGGRDLNEAWDRIRDHWGAQLGDKPAAAADDTSGVGRGDEGGRGGTPSPESASRAATQAARGYAPLAGLPSKPIKVGDEFYVPGPIGRAKDAAVEYMRRSGLPYNPPRTYVKVNPARATRIADAYEQMKHDPDDPAVKASYDALAKEVLAQWQVVKDTGLKIDWMKPDQPDPYAKSLRMAAMDVTRNNHLWVFPTEQGFGSGDAASTIAEQASNPMLRDTGEVVGGHKMLVNDVFRIVHDYFGHFKEGVGFRADGEDNAWRSHASMFSDAAMPALTSETRGQNSWVNFGPSAAHNKTASPGDTVYAPQKVGLMPDWTWKEGRADPQKVYARQGGNGTFLAAIWKPTVAGRQQALLAGVTPVVFHELTGEAATAYREIVWAAKAAGADVEVLPADDYRALRLFVTADRKAGFASKAGKVLHAFEHPRAEFRNFQAAAEALVGSLREWDESKHPRVPSGPGGGEFTSGGGGGGDIAVAEPSSPTSTPAAPAKKGKKEAKVEDFTKADITLDSGTRVDSEKRQKFIKQWNDKVGAAPEEFKKEFLGGLPATMSIEYQDYDDSLRIRGELISPSGTQRIGTYTRTIDFRKSKASSDYFKIHDEKQGGGIGKKLLRANVEMYRKLGLDKVEVHADIDVGGYAWARYGYVPTKQSWNELRTYLLNKLDRTSGGGGGGGRHVPGRDTYTPGSWDEISDSDQSDIKDAWMRSTRDEFIEGEIERWREDGQALNDAKNALAESFQISSGGHNEYPEWAFAALENWHDKLPDDAKVPFTDKQILGAVWVRYNSRDGDGREDPEIEFQDAKLTEPEGFDPRQQTLPGIEPIKPHEALTQDMRDGIEKELVKSFTKQAESDESDIDPPDFSDSVADYQGEYWDSMSDRDRYRWASDNGSLPEIDIEPDEDEETSDEAEAEVAAPVDAKDAVRQLLRSRDPKAVWAVADSTYGKQLLKNSDWQGVIDFSDKETMDRFNAYVGHNR